MPCGHDLIGSSSSPAGESPVRVAARRPGSRLAAWSGNGSGRSPASKAPLGEATERSVAEAKPAASLDMRESRAGRITAKAMEAVKILEVQPRRTPRRKRARNVQTVTAGTGEALPGRSALRLAWKAWSYNRCGAGKWSGAGRESEAVVVPIEPQDNTTCGEGRAAASFTRRDLGRMVPGECRSG